MTTNLFTFVSLYSRGLETLSNILDKSAEHARKAGMREDDILEWALVSDMLPLRRQAQLVCQFAGRWPAEVAGLTPPPNSEGESSLSEIHNAIAATKVFLDGLSAEQFAGRGDAELTLKIDEHTPTLPMERWLTVFATTNFYFHLTMAYAIGRLKGVSLVKRDFFAGGL